MSKSAIAAYNELLTFHETGYCSPACPFCEVAELEAERDKEAAATTLWILKANDLQRECDALVEAARWIPVSEMLPQDGQKVICRYDGVYEARLCGFWTDGKNYPHFGYPGETDGKGSQPATHWMPLPEPPKGDK